MLSTQHNPVLTGSVECLPCLQTPSLWKSLLPGKRFRTTKTTPQWATSRDSLAQNSSTRVQLDSSDNHSSTGSSSLICSIPEPVKTQEVELATGSQINSLINFEGESASSHYNSLWSQHLLSEELLLHPASKAIFKVVKDCKGSPGLSDQSD